MNERLMTVAEVAAFLRLHRRTIERYLADGRLTRIDTPGGQPRVAESEVKALLPGVPCGDA